MASSNGGWSSLQQRGGSDTASRGRRGSQSTVIIAWQMAVGMWWWLVKLKETVTRAVNRLLSTVFKLSIDTALLSPNRATIGVRKVFVGTHETIGGWISIGWWKGFKKLRQCGKLWWTETQQQFLSSCSHLHFTLTLFVRSANFWFDRHWSKYNVGATNSPKFPITECGNKTEIRFVLFLHL